MSAERHAEKLIDVYLAWVLSTDTEAGWHQSGMLQTMIEFRGCIPPSTGNDQADLKMIREIEYLRKPHALLAEARELIGKLPERHRMCLLIHRHAHGTYDRAGRRWTQQRIAGELGMTVAQYRHYRTAASDMLLDAVCTRQSTRLCAGTRERGSALQTA